MLSSHHNAEARLRKDHAWGSNNVGCSALVRRTNRFRMGAMKRHRTTLRIAALGAAFWCAAAAVPPVAAEQGKPGKSFSAAGPPGAARSTLSASARRCRHIVAMMVLDLRTAQNTIVVRIGLEQPVGHLSRQFPALQLVVAVVVKSFEDLPGSERRHP